jgi:hypothetical protein
MARAWARGALTAALLAMSGCSLILDFGGDITDGGVDQIDGGQFCDIGEPNNTQAMGQLITAGGFQAAICPEGDRDYYVFTVNGAQDMTVEITFDNMNGLGDLDMLLFNAAGAELMPKGNGFGDTERIERTSTSTHGRLDAGDYAVQVFAFDNGRENTYQLELTIDPPGGGIDAGIIDAGPPDA